MRLHIIKRGVEFLGDPFAVNNTVSMGESKYEEVAVPSGHGDCAERRGRLQDLRLVSAADSPTPVPAGRDVLQPLLGAERLRSLWLFGCCPDNDSRALELRASRA